MRQKANFIQQFVNKWNFIWVGSCTCINIAFYACMIMLLSFSTTSKKNIRKKIDSLLLKWAQNNIALARIHLIINRSKQLDLSCGGPYVVMCNHVSLYDISISFVSFPDASLRMVAKKELQNIPFMGRAMRLTEFIFIDRQNRREALENLQHGMDSLHDGITIWIAPEGTRSKNAKLLKFKKGGFYLAKQAQAKIIPVGIVGVDAVMAKENGGLKKNCDVEVNIGDVISPDDFDSIESLMLHTRNVMADLSNRELV